MDSNFRLVWMNQAYLAATMRKREDIIGKPMFEAFPSDPETESFRLLDNSLRSVLRTGETDEIALIRYDIRSPSGEMETHYWSATHTPLLDRKGGVEFILQHTVNVTELHKLRQLREQADLVRRAEKVQSRNLDLVRESRRMVEFFYNAPGFVAVLNGPDHIFEMANTAYLDIVGRNDIVGSKVAEALPEVVEQGFVDVLDKVFQTGEVYIGRRERVVLDDQNDESQTPRYLNFIFQPILTVDGEVTGIIVQGHDITDEVAYEERQKLLIDELQHRVKNTLAVVQALATQTFRPVPAAGDALELFSARLASLSAAHSMLTQSNWGPTSMRGLLDQTLGASLGDLSERVSIEGPEHLLDSGTALGLTMILHELATNAVKHGSLSVDEGRVTVNWSISKLDDKDIMHLVWQEADGPPVSEPTSRGFGSRLIERGLNSGGQAVVSMNFLPGGLRCSFDIHLSRNPQEARYMEFSKTH